MCCSGCNAVDNVPHNIAPHDRLPDEPWNKYPEVPLLYWAVEVETFSRVLLTLALLFNNLFYLFTRILNAPRLG
jgi:hypothetical protein